jgi:hypothetical protein
MYRALSAKKKVRMKRLSVLAVVAMLAAACASGGTPVLEAVLSDILPSPAP